MERRFCRSVIDSFAPGYFCRDHECSDIVLYSTTQKEALLSGIRSRTWLFRPSRFHIWYIQDPSQKVDGAWEEPPSVRPRIRIYVQQIDRLCRVCTQSPLSKRRQHDRGIAYHLSILDTWRAVSTSICDLFGVAVMCFDTPAAPLVGNAGSTIGTGKVEGKWRRLAYGPGRKNRVRRQAQSESMRPFQRRSFCIIISPTSLTAGMSIQRRYHPLSSVSAP